MQKVNETMNSNMTNYLTNYKAWAPVTYNVAAYGIIGDGINDNTTAIQSLINLAISEHRKAIFFQPGIYIINELENADKVVFFGDNATVVGSFKGEIYQIGVWANNTDIKEIEEALKLKANTTEVNKKADKVYVDARLADTEQQITQLDEIKADDVFVQNGLNELTRTKIDDVVQEGSNVVFKSNGVITKMMDLSVTANAALVQSYIDTLVSNGNIQGVRVGDSSVGFTQLKVGNANTSLLQENMLTDDLIELFNPKKITVGKGLSGVTDVIVDSANDNMTEYMAVPANSSLLYKVDGVNGFTLAGATRKIGVWDSNLQFLYTLRISDITEFVPTVNCFIRIVYQNSDINISIKNTKTKMISRNVIGKDSSFDYYKSNEIIEHFDRQKANFSQSYSEETGNLVPTSGLQLTEYIFLPANHKLKFSFNGVNWIESPAKSVNSSKIIVFDKNKNWEYTRRLNRIASDDFVFPTDKYIRIQVLDTYTPSIRIEGIYKLDAKKLTLSDSQLKDDVPDVIVVGPQSNNAGRGDNLNIVPDVSEIAYEFRAITDPTKLHPFTEPFGKNENVTGAIDDGNKKTGSMYASFAKAYHAVTGRKLIFISASEGGTSTTQWMQGTPRYNDLVNRINTFKTFAQNNNIKYGNIYFAWCQGEGDAHMSQSTYENNLNNIVNGLKAVGVKKCLLIRIGNIDGNPSAHANMIRSQTNICKTNDNIVLIGNLFADMVSDKMNMMKADGTHYTQVGYNVQGEQAGINAAYYIQNLKEPTMYDREYSELYYSHKS